MFSGKLSFMSNFYLIQFRIEGIGDVKSGEHAFNAYKTLDQGERDWILRASTPAESKRRGRSVTLRDGWDTGVRVASMSNVLSNKFIDFSLAAKLEATGNIKLVETNTWHDQFWGDCACPRHNNITGQNMLGELLMALRAKKRKIINITPGEGK